MDTPRLPLDANLLRNTSFEAPEPTLGAHFQRVLNEIASGDVREDAALAALIVMAEHWGDCAARGGATFESVRTYVKDDLSDLIDCLKQAREALLRDFPERPMPSDDKLFTLTLEGTDR